NITTVDVANPVISNAWSSPFTITFQNPNTNVGPILANVENLAVDTMSLAAGSATAIADRAAGKVLRITSVVGSRAGAKVKGSSTGDVYFGPFEFIGKEGNDLVISTKTTGITMGGGDGADEIRGGDGNDTLLGETGSGFVGQFLDQLPGQGGNDLLFG